MTCIIKEQKKEYIFKKRALISFSSVRMQNWHLLCVFFFGMVVGITSTPAQTTSTQTTSTQAASAQITQTQTVPIQSDYNVTTFAGDGSNSIFSMPNAVVVDKNRNVYVTNPGNNKIIKITSAGVVTTFAGSGTAGVADGNGSLAQFYAPTGIAIDSSGNLFVADKLNHRIRKITPNGDVTTFAGSSAGFADGVGAAAKFNGLYNIAIDSSDNLYITDTNNNRIRKITSAGVVTTIAGSGVAGTANGIGAAAQFNLPFGIAMDSSGNLYVSDTWNHLIRKITPNGTVTTLAGSVAGFSDGIAASAMFNAPGGMTIDTLGNIYVADISNQRIRKITAFGVVTTIAGTGTVGFADNVPALQALFNQPFGLSTDSAGNIYVADTSNARIRKLMLNINLPIASGTQSVGTSAIIAIQSVGTFAAGTQSVGTQSIGTQAASTLASGTQAIDTSAIDTQHVGTQAINTSTIGTQPAGTQAINTSAIGTQPVAAQVIGSLTGGTQISTSSAISTAQPVSAVATTQPVSAVATTQPVGTLAVGPTSVAVNPTSVAVNNQLINELSSNTQLVNALASNTQLINALASHSQPINTSAAGVQSVSTSVSNTQPAVSAFAMTQPGNAETTNAIQPIGTVAGVQPVSTSVATQLITTQSLNAPIASVQTATTSVTTTQTSNIAKACRCKKRCDC
ncbi:MAG: hypothetical protein V4544_02915 [Pseudomonadota bacterium]